MDIEIVMLTIKYHPATEGTVGDPTTDQPITSNAGDHLD